MSKNYKLNNRNKEMSANSKTDPLRNTKRNIFCTTFTALRAPGGGGRGQLGIFWIGMCRPALQIGTPFLKKISPKIDTPF